MENTGDRPVVPCASVLTTDMAQFECKLPDGHYPATKHADIDSSGKLSHEWTDSDVNVMNDYMARKSDMKGAYE